MSKKTDYKIDYVNKIYYNATRAYIYKYMLLLLNIGTFNNRVYGRHMHNIMYVQRTMSTYTYIYIYIGAKLLSKLDWCIHTEFSVIALLTNTEVCETHSKVIIIYV